jgi:hypothetical protein
MSNYWDSVPTMLAGVGTGQPVRWIYAEYGNFLNVYGLNNGINMTFNLKSSEDIDCKLQKLRDLRDRGSCCDYDIEELEERLRTYSNPVIGGNGDHSLTAIREGKKYRKGQKYISYHNGIKTEHVARGPRKVVSSEQKRAAEVARNSAHTESANAKRRKSISARGTDKELGI